MSETIHTPAVCSDDAAAVTVRPVGPEAAVTVTSVIHAGFDRRPTLDPPAAALGETTDSVAAWLADHGGLLAEVGGHPVATLLLEPHPDRGRMGLRRVAVRPDAQHTGVGSDLVAAAERLAADRGYRAMQLAARAELPRTVGFWRHLGYGEVARAGTTLTMARQLPLRVDAPTPEDTRAVGTTLAALLRPGDLVLLDGELGAGKTTLAQGLGEGLRVRGPVTSPTFVIARVHPSLACGPALLHADAYRLGGVAELDDLDLDTSAADAVTVVEWGGGIAEGLAEDRLEVALRRGGGASYDRGDPASYDRGETDPRVLLLDPRGGRWVDAPLGHEMGGLGTPEAR